MSYDLYFYRKDSSLPEHAEIVDYLNRAIINKQNEHEWFIINEDSETYFSINYNDALNDLDEDILIYEGFEDTGFSFNLNYLRPDCFGIYAFEYINKLCTELDLYILNPQTGNDKDYPYKPVDDELYKNWSQINQQNSVTYLKEFNLNYLPLEKTNKIYYYNLRREALQDMLGEEYFVPKVFLFKTKSTGELITISTWADHIPNVFPPTDYYLLIKEYKKLFRKVQEVGLIDSALFRERFNSVTEQFDDDCLIIHPKKSALIKEIFYKTPLEHKLENFAYRINLDTIVNFR